MCTEAKYFYVRRQWCTPIIYYLITDHKSLQELDLADDPRPVLCVTRIIKPAKPISAFSLLGLPGLGSRVASANVPETENEEESKLPHPLPKYTEAGLLDDPRNFSIAKNSSFAYRVHAMTRNDYSQEDGEKLVENITSVSIRLLVIIRPLLQMGVCVCEVH